MSHEIPSSLTVPAGLTAGYDPAWFEVLADVEDKHFWFRTRNQIIGAVAGRLLLELGPAPRVLEVGCGNGNVLRVLKALWPRGELVGLDLFEAGLQNAQRRCHCEMVQGDIRSTDLAKASFNLIGIFDVLEHLPDDENILEIVHSLLVPGGALLLTVPASPSLWSYFDEVAGHCRRYERGELNRKLENAGFKVVYLTHFMTTLLPLVWATRCTWSGGDGQERARAELKVPRIGNEVMRWVLQWEHWWISQGGQLPAGTSLLALAKRS